MEKAGPKMTKTKFRSNQGAKLSKNIKHNLKNSHDDLEFQVTMRTAELLEANKQLKQEIIKRREMERHTLASNAILQQLSKASSRKEFLDAMTELIHNLSGCRCAGIRIVNEDGDIPYESYTGFSHEFWESENWLSVNRDQCVCIRVITGKPASQDASVMTPAGSFCYNNTLKFFSGLSDQEKREFRGKCVENGFSSVAIIPIRYDDKICGAIHLADEKEEMVLLHLVEFIESLTSLIGEGIKRFTLTDKIQENFEIQRMINSLLRLSLKDIDLEELLRQSLGMIVSIPWLDFDSMACIFLFEDEPGILALKAQIGLQDHLQNNCKHVSLGKCICGNAAQKKEIQFVNCFDERHEIKYEGMVDHSHYCVPILFVDRLLGVINIRIKSGSHRDRKKDEFLAAIASSLAGIIQRKQAEQELVKTQKDLVNAKRLSDIGTLSATVAHELRNPLSAIRVATYNIKRKTQTLLLDKHLANIEKKVVESDQIINNLLFYSRIKTPHYENVNLHDILSECIESVKKQNLKQKILIDRKIKSIKNIYVEADPLQMQELFSNILNNAYDALSVEGGKIEIEAESYENEFIKVCIKDNGVGIDSKDLEKVYEPFFTTKSKGTGLGLSVCYQIADLHGGGIEIESEKGKGTSVTVVLPLKRVE